MVVCPSTKKADAAENYARRKSHVSLQDFDPLFLFRRRASALSSWMLYEFARLFRRSFYAYCGPGGFSTAA